MFSDMPVTIEKINIHMKSVIYIFLAIVILTSGCTGRNTRVISEKTPGVYIPNYTTPKFVINSHQHSRNTEEWEKQFVDTYTKYHMMACVFWPMEQAEHGIAFAKAHPDLVIPYIQISIDSPTVLDDIKKAHAMGYKGFGEIPSGNLYRYDDERYEPVWTLLEQIRMVPLFHTGVRQTGIFDLLRPATLATIAAKHPKLNLFGAHMGNPWYDEAAEGSRRNRNLFWDLTGSSLIKKENDPGVWKEYLWWTDDIGKPHTPPNARPAFEHIVFGTDEGPDEAAVHENIRRFNRMLDANNIPDSTRAKMWGLTLAEIHGIPVPAVK